MFKKNLIMDEKNEIILNDNLINDNDNNKNSYKTFNILKDIQNLLKKESNCKDICKIILYFIIT